jgi:hypothetical protein
LSQDQFQILYDGSDVRTGSMDVYDLAPALLSVGDLVRDANRVLNEDRAQVSLQVHSDFKRGSFEISLLLDQGIVEHAKTVLFGGAVIDAKTLVDIIFGHPVSLIAGTTAATGAVVGVIKLYKMLHGEKPALPSVIIEDKSTVLIQNINVESKTAQLYMNDSVRSNVDRLMRPLAKDGIDILEVYKGKELIERLEKSDIPDRVLESSRQSAASEVLTDIREALLKVVKANFEEGKWTFSDGTAKFNASINDQVFERKLDNREIGFYKGDVLRVRLKTVQALQPSGRFKTDYSIEEVIDHRPLPTQRRMEMKPPASEPPKLENGEKKQSS